MIFGIACWLRLLDPMSLDTIPLCTPNLRTKSLPAKIC